MNIKDYQRISKNIKEYRRISGNIEEYQRLYFYGVTQKEFEPAEITYL